MKNGYDKLHARQIRKIQIADSLIVNAVFILFNLYDII